METKALSRPRGEGPSACKPRNGGAYSEARPSYTRSLEQNRASTGDESSPKKSSTRRSRFSDGSPSLICIEDFNELNVFFKYCEEAILKPEDIFILFTEKITNDICQFEPFLLGDTFDNLTVEETVAQYLELLPLQERKKIQLIKCKVSEEELHKVSLSRIYPWCVLEKLKLLPTLVRLDGCRVLKGSDLSDFNKLDLTFRRYRASRFKAEESLSPQTHSKGVILNLSPGFCSLHGEVFRTPPEHHLPGDMVYPCKAKVEKKECQKVSNDSEICYEMQVLEVERRPKVEPVVETPSPIPVQKPKKGKGKKKGKGNKKGKGKGKGKGKKK